MQRSSITVFIILIFSFINICASSCNRENDEKSSSNIDPTDKECENIIIQNIYSSDNTETSSINHNSEFQEPAIENNYLTASPENTEAVASKSDGINSSIITLPEGIPFWEGSHMEIDESQIAEFAMQYCENYGVDVNALDFICGWLPLEVADQYCLTSPDKELMNKYLGSIYISGYFGGVWLRDVLFSNPEDSSGEGIVDAVKDALMKTMPEIMRKVMERGGDKIVFKNLALLVGTAVATALNASDAAVIRTCGLDAPAFFTIYGYDYGYYYYLVENPPDGETPEDVLECNSFLDCRMKDHELETLNMYKPVLDDLLHPTPLWKCFTRECRRWVAMYEAKNLFGLGSVALGELVWENIMSGNSMFDNAYQPLLDLSARFMLVSELAILPTVKGFAESDDDSARCGLLQQAGMMAWLGGYFLGLSSNLPEGTFPMMDCSAM